MICPTCETEFDPQTAQATLPFCSTRCKQIDLRRWLDETYIVPVPKRPDQIEAEGDVEE